MRSKAPGKYQVAARDIALSSQQNTRLSTKMNHNIFRFRNKTSPRIKRSKSRKEVVSESSTYEEDNLYSGTLDLEDSSIANQSYSYDYEQFKSEYYQEESPKNTSNETSEYEDYSEHTELPTEINFNKTRHKSTKTADVPMENYCSVFLLFRIRVRQINYGTRGMYHLVSKDLINM